MSLGFLSEKDTTHRVQVGFQNFVCNILRHNSFQKVNNKDNDQTVCMHQAGQNCCGSQVLRYQCSYLNVNP